MFDLRERKWRVARRKSKLKLTLPFFIFIFQNFKTQSSIFKRERKRRVVRRKSKFLKTFVTIFYFSKINLREKERERESTSDRNLRVTKFLKPFSKKKTLRFSKFFKISKFQNGE